MLYGGILLYAFQKDDTISWRGIGGIDYWCCTFFGYKTPEYKNQLNMIGKSQILIRRR
jgi:hypothetical protein